MLLPQVNVKMCFEGMEESGSEGVDCACISDNYCEQDRATMVLPA
jgi:hypothetical protein